MSVPPPTTEIGGFGPAMTRDPERVAFDVESGYVSLDAARIEYGVVLDEAGRVNAAETERARGGAAESQP